MACIFDEMSNMLIGSPERRWTVHAVNGTFSVDRNPCNVPPVRDTVSI